LLPEMGFRDGPQEGFLHEVVGPVGAPCKRPRVTAKPGNFALDQIVKI